MLVARPIRPVKCWATVVETSDGAMAANAAPPTMLNRAISCHGSVMNEHRMKTTPMTVMPVA